MKISRIHKYINAYQLFQMLRFAALILPAILLSQFLYNRESLGLLESFILFSGIFSFFWINALFTTIMSDSTHEEEKKSYSSHGFIIVQFVSICILVIIFITNRLKPFIDPTLLPLLYFYIFFNNGAYTIENTYLLFNKKTNLLVYGTLYFIGYLLLCSIAIVFQFNIQRYLFALTLVSGIRYLWAWYLFHTHKNTITFTTAIHLLQKSSPLILSFFIAGIAEYFDSFLVKYKFGNDSLSVFRYGTREIPFVVLLASSLSVSMIPVLKKEINNGIEELKQRSKYLMHITYPISILLVLSAQYWFPFIFGIQFIESVPLFILSIFLLISRCVFPQTILQSLGERNLLVRISVIELTANILISLFLMYFIGIQGILLGTILAYMIEKVLLIYYVKKLHSISLVSYTPIGTWIFYSILLLAASAFATWQFKQTFYIPTL